MTNFSAWTCNFYGLSEIHRYALISKGITNQNNEYVELLGPSDLKLRPIVAGPTCPTRSLSDLSDKILKPFILHVKIFVRDNIGILERSSRVSNGNTILATLNVTSLYTIIPHAYGLKTLS